jgi:RNA polymerase sigma factor (sigma-70 family)
MCIVHPLDLQSPAAFVCAQQGCQDCLHALLHRHEGLVHAILQRQWRGDMPYVDLLQEGRTALWQALVGFDPQRGVAFASYGGRVIERHLWRAILLYRRQATVAPTGWSRLLYPDPQPVVEQALWWQQLRTTLQQMVAALPSPGREVVIAAYGLHGSPAQSLAAIGRRCRVTREAVRLWRNQALALLRMPLFSAELRELCQHNSRTAYRHAQALNRAWLGRVRRRQAR